MLRNLTLWTNSWTGNGGKALGAVARAGKGNHERGILGAQEVARGAHDVGRGDGLKVVEIECCQRDAGTGRRYRQRSRTYSYRCNADHLRP